MAVFSTAAPGTRDYVVYWASGQQAVRHANPYDSEALLRIERSAGFPAGKQTMYMRNPPWALPLVYPLGFIGSRAGWMLWSTALLGCLIASVHMVWVMHGRPRNRRVLLGYSFAPALICVIYGQTSLFPLIGLVLFLRLHRAHPLLAGMSLWLCALKPHLFLPFGIVLIAWVVVTRSYKIAGGAAGALAASSAIAYLIDPMAWTHYSQMVHTSGIGQDFIPCFSFLFRYCINPKWNWLQYIPCLLASIWALRYYWQRRTAWEWQRHGSLLILNSILWAPYCWLFDQALVIPAVLHGAFLARSRRPLAALALASALVEIALLCDMLRPGIIAIPAIHHWTYWTAPAWLAWFVVTCRPATPGSDPESNSLPETIRMAATAMTTPPRISTT